jgi:peptidoglycan/LPS O-acetylase OafA/YrhL
VTSLAARLIDPRCAPRISEIGYAAVLPDTGAFAVPKMCTMGPGVGPVARAARGAGAHQPQLDGIRAVAVLTIIVFHATSLLPGGYIGVDLFFVLSGFLITRILLREVDTRGSVSMKRFLARRALRLLPALFAMCVIVAPLFVLLPITDRSASLLGVFGALTYSSSLMAATGHDLGWMIHTWSLSVEEYFYLVWPAVLVFVATRRHRLAVVSTITVAAIAYRMMAGVGTDWSMERITYAPDTRAEQLLIGACAAFIAAHRAVRPGPVITALAVLTFPAFALLPGRIGGPLYYQHGGSTLIALAAAFLVLGLFGERSRALTMLASLRPLVWVGERSYGIYLWNLPIVALIAATPLPGPLQLPVKLALSFLVPALSYRYVELPFLRRKARFGTPTAPVQVAAHSPAMDRRTSATSPA